MIRRTCGEVTSPTVDADLMAQPPTLPFLTEGAYAAERGLAQPVLAEASRAEGGRPPIYPASDFYDLSPLAYDFPALTLTTLRDVVVRGRSNVLTTPDAILRHGLVERATEIGPEEFYGHLRIAEDWASATWAAHDPFETDYLAEAAVFTDGTSFNYAHWMTEILPRIAAFVSDAGRARIPLVVDSDLHPNLMRSLEIVAGPDAVIRRLAPEATLRVGVLHNVSPSAYAPFKLRPQSGGGFSHGLFSPPALRASVARLRAGLALPAGDMRPRLLLRRNSGLRRLVNEGEIDEMLVGLGFTPLEPERLSLDAQIEAYSGAGMVVGASGAALTNLIFARPDCPVVVLMGRFRLTAYWYWRRMAAAAGAGPVVHAVGEQLAPLDDPYDPLAAHQDFHIALDDVRAAIDAAEALRR